MKLFLNAIIFSGLLGLCPQYAAAQSDAPSDFEKSIPIQLDLLENPDGLDEEAQISMVERMVSFPLQELKNPAEFQQNIVRVFKLDHIRKLPKSSDWIESLPGQGKTAAWIGILEHDTQSKNYPTKEAIYEGLLKSVQFAGATNLYAYEHALIWIQSQFLNFDSWYLNTFTYAILENPDRLALIKRFQTVAPDIFHHTVPPMLVYLIQVAPEEQFEKMVEEFSTEVLDGLDSQTKSILASMNYMDILEAVQNGVLKDEAKRRAELILGFGIKNPAFRKTFNRIAVNEIETYLSGNGSCRESFN
jgi:hypothetical protein